MEALLIEGPVVVMSGGSGWEGTPVVSRLRDARTCGEGDILVSLPRNRGSQAVANLNGPAFRWKSAPE